MELKCFFRRTAPTYHIMLPEQVASPAGERERANVCVCVCVCERERERERKRQRAGLALSRSI